MINKTFKSLLAVTAATLAVVGAAQAGGFTRGKADTQLIYEEGNFNMRSSVTIVSPTREYTVQANPANIGADYAETYAVPSLAFKMNLTEDLRCGLTMVNASGGSTKTPFASDGLGTTSEEFVAYEYGTTCGYKFDLSKGRAWLLGGVFMETFDYSRGIAPGLGGHLKLDGKSYGYRIGAAYEIPEIALRAELLYRSGAENTATGQFTGNTGAFAGVPLGNPARAASLFVESPQNVELNIQSGVAPGWLAFGSVKWTDWSVIETLDITTVPVGTVSGTYYWRDGWTVTAGVGHAFNDTFSGLAAITWDRGVGTGWDLSADVWTLSLGGSAKDKWGGELRGGVGISRLGSAVDTAGTPVTADDSAVGTDWSVAGSIGYAMKW